MLDTPLASSPVTVRGRAVRVHVANLGFLADAAALEASPGPEQVRGLIRLVASAIVPEDVGGNALEWARGLTLRETLDILAAVRQEEDGPDFPSAPTSPGSAP